MLPSTPIGGGNDVWSDSYVTRDTAGGSELGMRPTFVGAEASGGPASATIEMDRGEEVREDQSHKVLRKGNRGDASIENDKRRPPFASQVSPSPRSPASRDRKRPTSN